MKASSGFCIALIVVICLLRAAEASVFELNDETTGQFDGLLADTSKTLLVVAHNKPCLDRCEQDYAILRDNLGLLTALDATVQVFRVDIADFADLGKRFDLVQPHGVFLVFKAHIFKLDNPEDKTETPEKILNHARNVVAAKLIQISSKEQVSAELKEDSYLRIYHGSKRDDSYNLVEIVTKSSLEKLYFIEDKSLAKEFKIEAPGFYTYRRSDAHALPLPGRIYESRLMKFISTSATPVPQSFSLEKVEESLHSMNLPVLLVYGLSKQVNQRIRLLLQVNSELLRSYFHVYELTDPNDVQQKHFFKECLLHEGDDLLVCILRIRDQIIYRYLYQQKHLGDASFRSFISNYVLHRLTPQFKTEDIKEQETGKVHNLNLESYSEFMSISTPAVLHYLVMFYYEDNCKKCDEFTPTFIEAANENVDSHVTFMRINLSKNEMPETFHIKTPAVHFTTGYDDPYTINYRGKWTAADFNMWVVRSRDEYFHILHYDKDEAKVARKMRYKKAASKKQVKKPDAEQEPEAGVDL